MEHLQHFGLPQDPFRNDPDLRAYIETREHTDALRRLERGVRQWKGLCLLVGEVGAGKTMVARQLFEALEEEVFDASLLVMLPGAVEVDWVFHRFARQLGVEEPAGDRSALLAQLYDHLAMVREDGRHAVLFIDDAHLLGSPDAVAELAGLLSLEYEDRRLLSLALVGLPETENLLAGVPALAERVEVKVALSGLDAQGAKAYLAQRIESAGGNPKIFNPSAVAALHRLGGGHPGQMNRLADNALFEAFLAERSEVTQADVERAAKDLAVGDAASLGL